MSLVQLPTLIGFLSEENRTRSLHLNSDALIDSGFNQGVTGDELGTVADIISDHPSTFADIWKDD